LTYISTQKNVGEINARLRNNNSDMAAGRRNRIKGSIIL